jgi:hypothetical protein
MCYIWNIAACIPFTIKADLARVSSHAYSGIACNLYYSITEHQNWFGMDDNLGPVAVSIRRERIERQSDTNSASPLSTQPSHAYHYRLLIRTSEVSCILILENGC